MVPDGWQTSTIGDHVDLLSGHAFKSAEYSPDLGDVALLRGDNIAQGYLRWRDAKRWPKARVEEFEKYLLEAGDFVIAMDRTWIPAGVKVSEVNQCDLPCLLVQRVSRLRTKSSLDQRLLHQFFFSHRFSEYVKRVQTETAVPHISANDIREFPILLPPPQEQRHMAEILCTWDQAIETVEKLIENSQAQKKAMMQQLLSGRIRFPECESDKWAYQCLKDVCVFLRDGTHGTHKRVTDGIPLLSAVNILENGTINFDESSRISKADYDQIHAKYEIERNDVLVTVVGTLGRVALVKDTKRFSLQRSVAIVRVNDSLLPEFFYYVARDYAFQRELKKRANVTAQPGVYLNELGKILVPVPSIQEQQKIVAVLNNAATQIQDLVKEKICLERQKRALMQQLLTGKRRASVSAEKEAAVA